jgi:hypothetical protein
MRFSKGAADAETTLETLKLVIYLVPIFGFFPSLWSLYRREAVAANKPLAAPPLP